MSPFDDASARAAIRRDFGYLDLSEADLDRLRQAPRNKRDVDVLRDINALMDRWRNLAERAV